MKTKLARNRRENAFHKSVKNYGFNAAVRQAKNLGVDFIDAYVGFFGRMPSR